VSEAHRPPLEQGLLFKSLDEGAKVSNEATQGRKGMQAENVSAV
jgi:cold shock CspA family protein